MGKSNKDSSFENRTERLMHRSEDDLGYLDSDISDEAAIAPDAIMSGSGDPTTASTATIQAKAKTQQEQTSLQDKRGNQPDR